MTQYSRITSHEFSIAFHILTMKKYLMINPFAIALLKFSNLIGSLHYIHAFIITQQHSPPPQNILWFLTASYLIWFLP